MKYGNHVTRYNGMRFDSKKEARRYTELSSLEKAGKIADLRTQVKFVLIPAQYEQYERYGKNGKRLKPGSRCVERECTYFADFVYWQDGHLVVEDTKGFRTKEYMIKRKLMLHVHGIRIKEV